MQIRKTFLSLLTAGLAFGGATTTMQAQLADLTINSFRLSSTNFTAGRTVTANLVVRNSGLSRAAACRLRFQLAWGTFSQQTIVEISVPAISAQRSWATTEALQIPIDLQGAGRMALVAHVDWDDTVRELSNTNNSAHVFGTGVQRADFQLEQLQVTTRRWIRGQPQAVSVTVKNAGALPTQAVEIALYISRDPRITPSDTRLARATLGPIQPGASRTQLLSGNVPANWPLGVCAIGYYVDTRNVQVEALENNNAIGINGTCAVDGSYTSFGTGCVASTRNRVLLSGVGTPIGGSTGTLRVSNTVGSRPVILLIGGSNTTWNRLRLPIDLAPLGAAGCALSVSPDANVPGMADIRGQFNWRLPLPASLAGEAFYAQAVATGARNRLTVATSNGVEVQIGN